jgi:RecA-family ATPase
MSDLPHSSEAERGVIGALLKEPQRVRSIARMIGPEAFHDERHGVLFAAMERMVADGKPVDLLTVTQYLTETGKLETAGGAARVTEIFTETPTAQNADYLAEIVAGHAARRRLVAEAERLRADAANPAADVTELTRDATARFAEITASACGKANDGLPDIVDAAEWLAKTVEKPSELIAGILHRGSKLVLGGSSKSFKTWALLDMAASVATGSPWWGQPTQQAPVLYLNLEIQDGFLHSRLFAIRERRGLTVPKGSLFVWNLRGRAADFAVLLPKIAARVNGDGFGLVVLDPVYRGLGNRDENKAGDIAALLNEVERLAVQTGAAVAFSAHFSKGLQAGKEHADRISGSGVFARDPDTILTLTRHEEADCFTIEATLRNFPPLEPFVVRWAWPLFERADGLNPAALKSAAGRPKNKTPTLDEYLLLFPDSWTRTPKESLRNWSDIRRLFTASRWNRDAEPQLRQQSITAGRLAEYRGRCNSRLIGKPNVVKACEGKNAKQ